eukprot:CAMPEP_0172396824 /NCGR_PEP_ID=MMETSP1061-20121228/27227_1 /TAXON_ID=37318 /ORGANISM="Pseudo-nitzschia pungens, Strain cf. pungens" /LENGTH=68 /DNA_ID=CAMNT_0013128795 /DNA_START=43 /DNA_END=252 /DNA_ORIENTATION=+
MSGTYFPDFPHDSDKTTVAQRETDGPIEQKLWSGNTYRNQNKVGPSMVSAAVGLPWADSSSHGNDGHR